MLNLHSNNVHTVHWILLLLLCIYDLVIVGLTLSLIRLLKFVNIFKLLYMSLGLRSRGIWFTTLIADNL